LLVLVNILISSFQEGDILKQKERSFLLLYIVTARPDKTLKPLLGYKGTLDSYVQESISPITDSKGSVSLWEWFKQFWRDQA